MLRIHQALQSGQHPNATTLATELEVSAKSIHRDLEFMRDRLELPLAYDHAHNGYHYTEEVGNFPTLQITEGELFALLVAEKALQQYRGTTFERPLISAFKKMAASLPDTVSLNIADWEQTISFRTSAEPILNLEIFDTLAKAAGQRTQLQLTYRKPGQRATELRVVDPYHLANINGEWFLFAWCICARTFAHLSRPAFRRWNQRATPSPVRKNSLSKNDCATVLECNQGRGVLRWSFNSMNWSPIISAKKNGTSRKYCAN